MQHLYIKVLALELITNNSPITSEPPSWSWVNRNTLRTISHSLCIARDLPLPMNLIVSQIGTVAINAWLTPSPKLNLWDSVLGLNVQLAPVLDFDVSNPGASLMCRQKISSLVSCVTFCTSAGRLFRSLQYANSCGCKNPNLQSCKRPYITPSTPFPETSCVKTWLLTYETPKSNVCRDPELKTT